MITVKLYGLLRVESGIRELQMEADHPKAMFDRLQAAGLDRNALKGCYVLINGAPASRRATFKDGDVVQLLPPVAGG